MLRAHRKSGASKEIRCPWHSQWFVNEEEKALWLAMQRARADTFANEMLGHARKTVVEQSTASIVKSRAYYLLKQRDRKSL